MTHNLLKTIKIFCIIYAGALLLSWIIQIYFPTSDKPNRYQEAQVIVDNGKRIDHQFLYLANSESDQSIILLPDLFGGQEFLLPLARMLDDSLNVIIPEYPQVTTNNVSVSHSVQSRARFIDSLVDSLNLENVHLLGHGYGGLIAIDLVSDSTQTQYQSLVLLSSYGPQELQFLGNHIINRSLYSTLYPVVTVFKYLVPHMGWYYEQPVDFNFANTLIALDQRPVRDQLQRIEIPVHILQPIKDRYVSLSIAEEIHRLVPHSSLFLADGDHLTTRKTPGVWNQQIIDFVNIVHDGMAIGRDEAIISRLEASQEPFDADKFATIGGWTLIIILFLLALISLISEDLACIAGGLLVASGIIDFWFAVLGACIGVLGADVILYFLGKWIGNPILQWIPFRWFIKEEDIVRAEQMYRMRGVEIIFATRFLPGTRLPVYLVSGMIRVKFSFFLLYFVISMMIWAPLLVGISALIGQPMISYMATYQEYALWLIPIILGTIYLAIKGIIMVSTPNGRRKIVVKYHRFREKYLGK
ncbi:VTT domain-containing protein [Rhodohalobacter sp. 614A]|uniref:VTT domain-containing protein n=1 Tax=Rhodohalobacter sp. 614A TaxID=2908649 RepID=UPI001F1C5B0C|nr:VTT domain-containing protein [Rhodohalobacter sp. 614A]